MTRDLDVVTRIIQREGGFTDHPADKGGPTNFGITIGRLSEVRGVPQTADDVRMLSQQDAATIYINEYIVKPKFDKITNDSLFELVVDTGVLNGRERTTLWLQRAAGALEDGILGPRTLNAVNMDPRSVYNKLCALRVKSYGAIVSKNASQVVFIAGWLNRVAEFISRGFSLA